MELGELKNFVREKANEGKVVFMTCEGPMIADLDEFIQQGAAGIL